MKCLNCQEDLLVLVRMGVEIDYCPACHGVWLDRGELDKIIAAVEAQKGKKKPKGGSILPLGRPAEASGDYRHEDDYFDHKKRSFLKELFKF